MVVIFGLVLVLGELACAIFFEAFYIVLAVQLLCGLSVGILMGACSRIIATGPLPSQIFGFVDMMAVLLMSFMIAGVGIAVGNYGIAGGYLFATGFGLLFVLMLYQYREPEPIGATTTIQQPKLHIGLREIATVSMGMLFVTCSGMGFAFLFTMALNLGLDYAMAGSYLGVLVFVSAIFCQIGGWCGARFGPMRPLAGAFIVCALGWYVAINASSQLVFMSALVPAIFSLQFNFPILLALSGTLDKRGQWAAIASPLLTSGFAWAAIVAGFIVDQWEVATLGTATVMGLAICLLLLYPSRTRATEKVNVQLDS
jgi:hypothetical protein